jgi:hypothetical protein
MQEITQFLVAEVESIVVSDGGSPPYIPAPKVRKIRKGSMD